jgi:hypothetical protein
MTQPPTRQPSGLEQVVDLFLLRTSTPDYASDSPYYTTGSIVTAAIMRVAIIAVVAILLNDMFNSNGWWWTAVLFTFWLVGVFPAWLQYQKFHEDVEKIQAGTLCGACRHFNPTNQLCMVLDEHVTSEEPPCEGEAWEPRS